MRPLKTSIALALLLVLSACGSSDPSQSTRPAPRPSRRSRSEARRWTARPTPGSPSSPSPTSSACSADRSRRRSRPSSPSSARTCASSSSTSRSRCTDTPGTPRWRPGARRHRDASGNSTTGSSAARPRSSARPTSRRPSPASPRAPGSTWGPGRPAAAAPAADAGVIEDMSLGVRVGVTGTPTFFVNGVAARREPAGVGIPVRHRRRPDARPAERRPGGRVLRAGHPGALTARPLRTSRFAARSGRGRRSPGRHSPCAAKRAVVAPDPRSRRSKRRTAFCRTTQSEPPTIGQELGRGHRRLNRSAQRPRGGLWRSDVAGAGRGRTCRRSARRGSRRSSCAGTGRTDLPQQEFPATGASQQVPPHVSVVQVAWQVPPEQVCPGAQARPQVPQFAGSVRGSTHLESQRVSPAAQACRQVPAEQAWTGDAAVAQVPQWSRVAREVGADLGRGALGAGRAGGCRRRPTASRPSPAGQTTLHPPQWEPLAAGVHAGPGRRDRWGRAGPAAGRTGRLRRSRCRTRRRGRRCHSSRGRSGSSRTAPGTGRDGWPGSRRTRRRRRRARRSRRRCTRHS